MRIDADLSALFLLLKNGTEVLEKWYGGTR